MVINVVTIEDFRAKALKAVDLYLKKPEDERAPCMFVLDSLGMLSTEKKSLTLNDKQVRDMTNLNWSKVHSNAYPETGSSKYPYDCY